MSWFDFLLKAKPVRNPTDDPGIPRTIRSRTSASIVDWSTNVLGEEALKHPVLFRCLHKIATSVQAVNWFAEIDPLRTNDERVTQRSLNAINNLLRYPNDGLAPDQLRYWFALNYATFGRVPFTIGFGSEQQPNGLYPLAAKYVSAQTNARGTIDSYTYGHGSNAKTYPSRRKASPGQTFAYEIYTPNLEGSLANGQTVTPLNAIGIPATIIMLLMRRAGETAAGHPNSKYIITGDRTLTRQQEEEIQELIDERSTPGGDSAGNVLFIRGSNIQVHKLDNELGDIHAKMPLDDMTRMIAGAFGIPISLLGLGAADGAKFAGNYQESRQAFWMDTIIPNYLVPIATGLTQAICPPGVRISFDLDSIPAIQDARATMAKNLTAVDFLTRNEKRELIGYGEATDEQVRELEESAKNKRPAQIAQSDASTQDDT